MIFKILIIGVIASFSQLLASPLEVAAIEGTIQSHKPKAIAVLSEDQRIRQLAYHAFNTHGAFDLKKTPQYTLRLTPAGATSVMLEVLDGKAAQTIFSQIIHGHSKDNAILRACDIAVTKLTGDPGYFAGTIAFISNRTGKSEVYLSDLFLQQVRQITAHKSDTLTPHLSPDGTKITYTSYFNSGFPDLFLYDSKAQQIQPIAAYKGTNTGGVFDPYGSRMAMVLSAKGNPEIFLANASGKNAQRLTTNRSIESSPSWSPDGNRLVFTSDQGGAPQIYEMDIHKKSMTRLPTNISRYCSEPDWNPVHEELIAFTASNASGFQVALYDRNTRQSRWLTAGGGDNLQPCWLNDGRHLLFTQRAGDINLLHIMDVQTGKITALHASEFGNTSQADFVYQQ